MGFVAVFDDEDGSHQRNPRTRPGRRVGFVKPGELRMPRLNGFAAQAGAIRQSQARKTATLSRRGRFLP
jgi:hypothetical protein